MATTDRKLFANIPQLKTEKDWPVRKFQVTHALKAAEQWQFAEGTAADGFATENLLLHSTSGPVPKQYDLPDR